MKIVIADGGDKRSSDRTDEIGRNMLHRAVLPSPNQLDRMEYCGHNQTEFRGEHAEIL